MSGKKILEVSRVVNGTHVSLKQELDVNEAIAPIVKELSDELAELGNEEVRQVAPLAPETALQLPHGLTPTPQLNINKSELPVLTNAPFEYSAADAVVEILDPKRSAWAEQGRTVKEIQQRLLQLSVRSVSNVQNFDWVVRNLVSRGRLRREKIDGSYKYYLASGVQND